MKFVVFALAVLAIIPLGKMLEKRPEWHPYLGFLLGILPFFMPDQLAITFWGEPFYRGDARGLEITIVDLVALTGWIALPKSRYPVPYRKVRWFYVIVAALSIFSASVPLHAAYSVWNIVRAYFLVAIVTRLCEQTNLAPSFVTGLASGVVYALVRALIQRYVYGYWRVAGDFSHPNTLGMAMNLVAPIALSLLLGGQGGKLAWATLFSATAGVIMTLSRGALASFGIGLVVVYLGSVIRRPTARKVWVAVGGMAAGMVMLLIAADTIIERFEEAPDASAEARVHFKDAARLMVEDRPFGIGINQYSYVLEHNGYGRRAGLKVVDQNGIAHHVYWLTTAELGWPGIVAYLLLLGTPLVLAFRGAWRMRRDIRGDVLLGCGVGLFVFYLQGLFEWAARQTPLLYLFFSVAGLVAALERQSREPGMGEEWT